MKTPLNKFFCHHQKAQACNISQLTNMYQPSIQVYWKELLESKSDGEDNIEHVEEFTLDDIAKSVGDQGKAGSEMSLYFYAKTLPLSKRRDDYLREDFTMEL